MCFTDGLTDTFNTNNDNLTIDLLKEIIEKNQVQYPEKINAALLNYAEGFKGENDFPDDIALLTLKVADLNF
jgi:phosphoserine phosphatase RsbU/P